MFTWNDASTYNTNTLYSRPAHQSGQRMWRSCSAERERIFAEFQPRRTRCFVRLTKNWIRARPCGLRFRRRPISSRSIEDSCQTRCTTSCWLTWRRPHHQDIADAAPVSPSIAYLCMFLKMNNTSTIFTTNHGIRHRNPFCSFSPVKYIWRKVCQTRRNFSSRWYVAVYRHTYTYRRIPYY